MKEMGRLVIDAQGTEKQVFAPVFPATIPAENIIAISDKKQVEVSWRRNFERIIEIAQAWKETYPYQDEARVDTRALAEYPDLPYLIWWASDMHIGSVDTQHDLLKKHIELIENTPNTGAVTLGDDIDFGILPKLEVRFMQAIFPQGQAFTAKDLMEEFNGRNPRERQLVLAHCLGNHTHSMMQATGILYENFYAKSKAAILPGIGELFLRVGNEAYEIALAHKYTGRSRLQISLEPKRLMEYQYPNADVAVVGDFHKAGFEKFFKGGKWHLAVRPGTYKVGTNIFEKNRGWGNPDLGGSCTLFYPDRHEALSFDRLEEGVAYLEALREAKGYK